MAAQWSPPWGDLWSDLAGPSVNVLEKVLWTALIRAKSRLPPGENIYFEQPMASVKSIFLSLVIDMLLYGFQD